jgi:hypothetical protein
VKKETKKHRIFKNTDSIYGLVKVRNLLKKVYPSQKLILLAKKMKKYFATLVLILSFFFSEAQDARGYGVGSNGVRSDGRLIDLFEDIKNRVTNQTSFSQTNQRKSLF